MKYKLSLTIDACISALEDQVEEYIKLQRGKRRTTIQKMREKIHILEKRFMKNIEVLEGEKDANEGDNN